MRESTLLSPATELQASMRRNFPHFEVSLERVERKEIGGLAITIAQATITRDDESDADRSSSSIQTVGYHETPDAKFPSFGLRALVQGERAPGFVRLPTVTFADQPEFSKYYFALTMKLLRTEAILDRNVRDWLLAHPGMHVDAEGGGVLVYRPDQVLQGGELDGFAQDAAEFVRLLDQARRTAADNPRQPSEREHWP